MFVSDFFNQEADLTGIIGTHIHSARDLQKRSIDDLDLAREALRLGIRVFVIKSHFNRLKFSNSSFRMCYFMSKKIIGIQLSNISMFHEGPENCLKFLQDTAGINTAFIYATNYHFYDWKRHKDPLGFAVDHPVAPPDFDYCDISTTFFKPQKKYFTGTPVFMEEAQNKKFGDRDLLTEAIEAGDKLGIDIYARCLEPYPPALIPGWHAVMSEDCYGRLHRRPCWNNPFYQQWWMSITENLIKEYPGLAGFKYGAERCGPLSNTLIRDFQLPLCFCRYCREKAEELHIDPSKAREGYIKLYEYVQGLKTNASETRDGVMIEIIRMFLEYPEIFAWERMQIQAEEHINELMYGNIHCINPEKKFGIHVFHWQSWDPFYRANINYEKMANYADFIKPVIYHDVAGLRAKKDLEFWNATWLKEFMPEQTLNMMYAIMNYNDAGLPDWSTLAEVGFNDKYVYNEVKRCVEAVKGKSLVLAGIGFDIPPYKAVTSKTPKEISEGVYNSVCASFDAGADGVLISRESDEMSKVNLEAAGNAVRKYL